MERVGPWAAEAACADVPTRVFYPEVAPGDPRSGLHASRIARAICGGCPVRAECLEYALVNHERWGIFGGLTETQRRPLLARRGRALAS